MQQICLCAACLVLLYSVHCDRIHCRWRPSFWDNVIMGGTAGSFVSCRRKFSTTSIMSATAQPWAPRLSRHMTVFSCVLSFLTFLLLPAFPRLSCSFYHSQFIFIHSYPFFFPPVSILIYMCYFSYQSLPPTQICLSSCLFTFPDAFTC